MVKAIPVNKLGLIFRLTFWHRNVAYYQNTDAIVYIIIIIVVVDIVIVFIK